MANDTTIHDPAVTLADFLATPVGDGTWSDVFGAGKIDQNGAPADASDIPSHPGRLYFDGLDDMFQACWAALHLAAKTWAAANDAARDAIGSDNGLSVGDILFNTDTRTIWYCVSVDGGSSSTWAPVRTGALEASFSLSLAGQIDAGESQDVTVSVPGAVLGDFVLATPITVSDLPASWTWSAFVSAADTVTIRVANNSGSATNPFAHDWRVRVEAAT